MRLVKQFHDETGIGIMESRAWLVLHEWDIVKATKDAFRKWGERTSW